MPNSEKNKPSADELTGGKCPVCGKPAVRASRPFCSKRCADVDLGRWMSGGYVIAGGHSDADEDGDDVAAFEAGKALPKGDRSDYENES